MSKDEDVRFIIDDSKGHSASFVYRPPNGDGEPLAIDAIPPHKHGEIIRHIDHAWFLNFKVIDE